VTIEDSFEVIVSVLIGIDVSSLDFVFAVEVSLENSPVLGLNGILLVDGFISIFESEVVSGFIGDCVGLEDTTQSGREGSQGLMPFIDVVKILLGSHEESFGSHGDVEVLKLTVVAS
jgi:hypothetical protein